MAASKSRVAIVLGALLLGVLVFFPYAFWRHLNSFSEMKAKAAMRQAYQIHQALFAYAQTHDGNFPVPPQEGSDHLTSNEAYRELFRAGLLDDEKLFYVQRSAWHDGKTKSDHDIGTEATGFNQALARNENHFAYVSGLNANTSDPTTPLVMDGFIPGSDLRWSKDKTEKGGVWKGRWAIVVRVSGAAKVIDLDAEGRVMEPIDGKLQNISKLIDKTPGAKALNPDG